MKLITVTWNHYNTFDIQNTFLYKSFKKHNSDKDFVHIHFNRNEYSQLETEFSHRFGPESEFILYKIFLLLPKLKDIDTDYIIFCDANDVTCLRPINGLIEAYDLDNFIIIGHEKNMWPPLDRQKSWSNYTGYNDFENQNRLFLNSGMILSKKTKYVEMLENMIKYVFPSKIKNFSNDQGVFTYYYNMKIKPEIKLDYSNLFVVNTFSRNVEEFYLNKSQLVELKTGIKPYFLHDNGWNHGSPKYHNHFELNKIYSNKSEYYQHLKNISTQTPINPTHKEYLIKLRDEFGVYPKVIYDVGACVLHWTSLAKEVWPNSEYILFEAMEESEDLFIDEGLKYHIGVLSDSDNKEVTFYKNQTFPGGNSYYMENPIHSPIAQSLFGNKSNQFLRRTEKLDTVIKNKYFPYPDFLKIDVQGCEIDILNGAIDVLKNVDHLIVELQHVDYNIGAKLCHESIPIIESLGFELITPKFSLSSHADADYHFKKKK